MPCNLWNGYILKITINKFYVLWNWVISVQSMFMVESATTLYGANLVTAWIQVRVESSGGYCLRLRHMQGVIFMCYEQMPLWLWCLSYSRVGFYWLRLYDEGFVDGCGQCWMGILLLLSLLLLLLCRKSRVRRASPSGVYLAGKLQWRFACGFNFGHSLWLPFVAALAVLRGGGCW